MRTPFGKLMDVLEEEVINGKYVRDLSVTIGSLAVKYDEPPERIMDAIDAIKERRGERSYLP